MSKRKPPPMTRTCSLALSAPMHGQWCESCALPSARIVNWIVWVETAPDAPPSTRRVLTMEFRRALYCENGCDAKWIR